MEILMILMIVVLGIYVLSPLFWGERTFRMGVKSNIQSLRKEKSSIEEALEELESEVSTGVIDEKEASELKESYLKRLREIEKEIENIVKREVEKRKKFRR
jgi:hypothetical protein